MKKSHITCLLAPLLTFQLISTETFAQEGPPDFGYVCGSVGAASNSPSNPPIANPICTDPNAVKYIRIAVHFILSEDFLTYTFSDDCPNPAVTRTYRGFGNFNEINDGNGGNFNGFKRAEAFVNKANDELATNSDHWRKTAGESYPTPPPPNKIRYVLVGTYFHRDNDAFNFQIDLSAIHAKYNVESNRVLDVYCVNSTNVPWTGVSLGFGNPDKCVFLNDYVVYLKPNCRDWSTQEAASNLNHEIGHSLALDHTWPGGDGCDDTPDGFIYDQVLTGGGCLMNVKANCWDLNPAKPGCPRKPCDEWPKISNNIMDYNAYYPHAYTLCQQARIQANLIGNGNSYIHSCNGCVPSNAFFYSPDNVYICPGNALNQAVHLNGEPSFGENKYLLEICEVISNQPDVCVSGYFTSGWQNGNIGDINLSSFYNFLPNKTYKLKLTVDNTDCPGSDIHEQLIYTHDCEAPLPPCCFGMGPSPNPFNEHLTVYYDAPEAGQLSLYLINLLTAQSTPLVTSVSISSGSGQMDFQTGTLSPGNYSLVALYKGSTYTKNVVKL